MTLKVTLEEVLDIEEPYVPSYENIAANLALDFESEIYDRLQELGLMQKDLASLMGVTPPAVSRALSNAASMTFKTASKMVAALGCKFAPLRLLPIGDARSIVDGADKKTVTSISGKEYTVEGKSSGID